MNEMKILILDNYDSFTYNLVQYIQEILRQKVDVFRNDQISLESIDQYDVIVLSPGPGIPKEAGIMPELIKQYAGKKSILGVCLGHQAIAEAFGGQLENLTTVYHGIATPIEIIDQSEHLFSGVDKNPEVGRYHSWVVKNDSFPEDLTITAKAENDYIMALSHKKYHVKGVQFHPESIMTLAGKKILENFFDEAKERVAKLN